MDCQPDKTTEQQIGEAVLRVLASSESGALTITDLKLRLPGYLPLTEADRMPSPTRRGEEVWELQMRRLLAHRMMPGNIVGDGYAKYRPRWLTITDAGRIHVRRHFQVAVEATL